MIVIVNRLICVLIFNLLIYKVLVFFCKIFLLLLFKIICFVFKVYSNVKNMMLRENRNNL